MKNIQLVDTTNDMGLMCLSIKSVEVYIDLLAIGICTIGVESKKGKGRLFWIQISFS